MGGISSYAHLGWGFEGVGYIILLVTTYYSKESLAELEVKSGFCGTTDLTLYHIHQRA